jgi:hypothetical protein
MQDLKAMAEAAGDRPFIIINPKLKVCTFEHLFGASSIV